MEFFNENYLNAISTSVINSMPMQLAQDREQNILGLFEYKLKEFLRIFLLKIEKILIRKALKSSSNFTIFKHVLFFVRLHHVNALS